jgi:hypothetical protein
VAAKNTQGWSVLSTLVGSTIGREVMVTTAGSACS